MFRKIAGFEFRYQVGHPVFWITSILFFLFAFAFVVIPQLHVGDVGNVHRNAPYAIGLDHLVMTIFYMFVTAAFVASVVVRDEETGFGPILKSTGVSKFDYLIGRFTGAYLVAALGFLTVPLGIFVGTLMPWVDPDTLGPNRLQDYAFAYGVLGLPSILLTAAIFFGVATATRSMMATYLGVIGLLVLWGIGSTMVGLKPEWRDQLAIGEPFGLAAYGAATRYWTAEERNTLLPALQGAIVWNRFLWIGLAVLIVSTAYGLFRFEARGAKLGRRQKLKALAEGADAPPPVGPLPKPRFDGATARAQLWKRTRFEMGQVFKSPVYMIVLALGLLNTVPVLWFSGVFYGTSVHPVTRILLQTLLDSFLFVPPIVAAFYAGELVWRERDRKVHEIVDASAIPDWAYVLPKTLAIALVLASTLAISAIAAMAVQLIRGYDNFEIDKYLLWYVLPGAFDWTLLAILAVFFQSIVPHKFVGWGLMVLYLIGNIIMRTIGWEDYLYHYGRYPGFPTPMSDMNGLGKFWIAATWFRIYWGAFALILTLLSYGLWRRGTETRLWPRLRRLPSRLKGPAGALAGLALVTFAASGAFIFLNTHVWNDFQTTQDGEKRLADAEKTLLRYEHAPEPTVTDVKLNLDLYPHAPRLVTKGVLAMENRTGAPITEMHLTGDPDLKWTSMTVTGAHLSHEDKRLNFRIYRFDQPLAPGAKATLEFTSLMEQRGFKNSGNTTRLVDNGTFVNNSEFGPIIGIDRSGFLQDRAKRRKYGLPPELRVAKLEDDSARAKNYIGNAPWVMSDITVTTDADQTPIAPGYKVSDVTHGARRTAEFKTDAPILAFFSVQSARYLEKHVNYKGIDIGVFYDRQHPYNVDRMIKAAEAGLDYFQANFGPYQFRQFRFIEFPDYATFAQSFANTVPWSEGLGFIADPRKAEDIDYVTYVGAHELGHQWWAHQEISAEMQGGTMLVETLAQYSALMVMEKMYGPDHIRKFLKYELDNYLRSRGSEAVEELPLARVENQPYIHYRKGAVVMYLLKDQIGEDAVNRALRSFLADWKFKGPPYPASKDLVAKFRAEAPADKQQLITDLFEKITIWDLKAKTLTAKKRADGKYDVRLTVEASKAYATGKGKETTGDVAGETFDVGLFTDKPGDKAFGSKSVLLFQKAQLKSGIQTLEFVTDKAPKFGGVDPYNKFIDRNSEDNVVPAG